MIFVLLFWRLILFSAYVCLLNDHFDKFEVNIDLFIGHSLKKIDRATLFRISQGNQIQTVTVCQDYSDMKAEKIETRQAFGLLKHMSVFREDQVYLFDDAEVIQVDKVKPLMICWEKHTVRLKNIINRSNFLEILKN